MMLLGRATISTYFELPFATDPTLRPGYWNSALELFEVYQGWGRDMPSEYRGPTCRINYCYVTQRDGLLVPAHAGWWLIRYESGRARWYCTDHLPVKYLEAIATSETIEECRAELHNLFPRCALPVA